MRFNAVCFGSAFVDIYLQSPDFKISRSFLCEVYGGKINVTKMVMTTGGGATNVAVGLERLGFQTAAVCAVGQDDWGLFIRKELRREGVSPIYIQQVEAQTSYSTILVSRDGGRTALVYRGASNQLSWRQVDWGKLDSDWFYLSSLGGDFNLLAKVIRVAQDKKIKLAFNPGSQEIGQSEKIKPFLKTMDVLLINLPEAAKLVGHIPKNRQAVFRDLAGLKIPVIAVTEGRSGASLLIKNKLVRAPAVKTETVEETGAGDAFASGFMAGIIGGLKPAHAFKMGLINGASVTREFGPKTGLLFAPEMNAWLKKF